MKRLLVVLLLVIPVMLVAQNRPVTRAFSKVGSTTTGWVGVKLGVGEKDLAFANRSSTATDTAKFAFNNADTTLSDATSLRGILVVLAGEIHNVYRIPQDTIWVKGTGTISYSITGVKR